MPPTIAAAAERLPHSQPTSHDPAAPTPDPVPGGSRSSRTGLNPANFIAAASGVALPLRAADLVGRRWGYDVIGLVVSAAGLIAFPAHDPAGVIVDRVRRADRDPR